MTLAIETFDDLVHIIETHPEWRRRLKRALFDIDIEAALIQLEKVVAELVATQRQQSAAIKQLIELQRRQADDIHVLKTDVSSLKGKAYEQEYRAKASGIFGRFIRRGRDRTDDIAERLHEAVASGQIPETELIQVLAADLLWGGKSYVDATDVIVVLEASWRAEVNDVERAHRRAGILRRIGFQAQALGVAVASNGQVNADSWRTALTTV